MDSIGLVLKSGEPEALVVGAKIAEYLKATGKRILLEPSQSDVAQTWGAIATDRIADEADLLIVLGGDGTILRAASLLNDKSMPVLGVNLGRVGFMAEILPGEALTALESALEGKAEYVTRMLLQITLPGGKRARVLNEAVIHWGGIARLIELDIIIGDSRKIELRADGLIVSTPIGSTAYSYAANGPLVHPDVEAALLTPICPYAGLKRPLLIPSHMDTELVLKKGDDLNLTLDGHTRVVLQPGQSVKIGQAPFPFTMVKAKDRDYIEVLKQKLGLI
jgi:NAD+ kinase